MPKAHGCLAPGGCTAALCAAAPCSAPCASARPRAAGAHVHDDVSRGGGGLRGELRLGVGAAPPADDDLVHAVRCRPRVPLGFPLRVPSEADILYPPLTFMEVVAVRHVDLGSGHSWTWCLTSGRQRAQLDGLRRGASPRLGAPRGALGDGRSKMIRDAPSAPLAMDGPQFIVCKLIFVI